MKHRSHVLLLRHCVRSTKTQIKFCDCDGSDSSSLVGEGDPATPAGSQKLVNLSDYIDAPMPRWNVPPMWCTEAGLEMIEQLGSYLLETIVGSDHDSRGDDTGNRNNILGTKFPRRNLRVQIVSDTSHRDADTALALAQGMRDALASTLDGTILQTSSLDTIEFHHDLFKPEDDRDQGPLCPIEYTDQELRHQIAEQTSKIDPMTKMGSNTSDLLLFLRKLGGFNSSTASLLLSMLSLSHDCSCLDYFGMGLPMELVKEMAEMAFYSRASGMDLPFLPSATDPEIYQLLEWADFIRSSERLNNIRYAKKGVVLVKSILEAISNRIENSPWTSSRLDELITLTVFAGHDSDIDAVATALGLTWTLPTPYRKGFLSSPPGSGILVSTYDDGTSSLAYVYPTFLTDGNALLQSVPISSTEPYNSIGLSTIDDIRRRLLRTLDLYPAINQCYEKAPTFVESIDGKQMLRQNTIFIAIGLILNAGLWAIIVCIRRCSCCRQRRTKSSDNLPPYSEVSPDVPLHASDTPESAIEIEIT